MASNFFPERFDQPTLGIQQPPFDHPIASAHTQHPQEPARCAQARAAPKLVAWLHGLQHTGADGGWHLGAVHIDRAVFTVADVCGGGGDGAGHGGSGKGRGAAPLVGASMGPHLTRAAARRCTQRIRPMLPGSGGPARAACRLRPLSVRGRFARPGRAGTVRCSPYRGAG